MHSAKAKARALSLSLSMYVYLCVHVYMPPHSGVNKLPYMVRKPEDVVICAKNIKDDRIAPIFHVSNVTGIFLCACAAALMWGTRNLVSDVGPHFVCRPHAAT